jgi:very-short-patch-repair endonuclease
MTPPEVVLWQRLRRGTLERLRFRRQHPLGPYILDFYCPAARIALEVDGWSHQTEQRARHDERRDAWLADNRIRVLRFPAADVLDDRRLMDVLATIETACAPSVGFADSSPVNGGASRPSRPLAPPPFTGEAAPRSSDGGGLGSSPAKRGRWRREAVTEGAGFLACEAGEVSPRSGDGGGTVSSAVERATATTKRPTP